jgi:hypothetical protein
MLKRLNELARGSLHFRKEKTMLLFEKDFDILIASIKRVNDRICDGTYIEIGIGDGDTSRHFLQYIPLDALYVGIDPGVDDPRISDERFFFFKKPSFKVAALIHRPSWVFVDGCHCEECVIRDFIVFGTTLKVGGEICFHDASSLTQGRDKQDYPFMDRYHNFVEARKGIGVRKALDKYVSTYHKFELVQKALEQEFGGVEVYRKIK